MGWHKGLLYAVDSNSFSNLNKNSLMEALKFRACASLVDNRGVTCFSYCAHLNGHPITHTLEQIPKYSSNKMFLQNQTIKLICLSAGWLKST